MISCRITRVAARLIGGGCRLVPVGTIELGMMKALTWYHRADAVHRWLTDQYLDLVRKLDFKMRYGSVPSVSR
jgi:hypothetical protein